MPIVITIAAPRLAAAVEIVVRAAGSDEREARLVASNLVEANLTGHDSHGVGMLPRYVDSIREGGLAVNAHPRVVTDAGALLAIDGQSGYGQVIGLEATDLAIERARLHGCCILGLAHSHHLGRIGHWAEQAARAGLVSIHFVNVLSRAIVAPWAGADARHGTNPFCVGVPRVSAPPIVLDFATSRIAQGKARVAYNKGEPVAPGILIDANGEPCVDPRHVVVPPFGALLPFGEHKGSGLALICEILGGALSGGTTWHRPSDSSRRVLNSMLSILIDPNRLGTAASFIGETDAFLQWFVSGPVAPGADRIRIAGEPERESRAQRERDGVPVDTNTWVEIRASGARVGVDAATLDRVAGIG